MVGNGQFHTVVVVLIIQTCGKEIVDISVITEVSLAQG